MSRQEAKLPGGQSSRARFVKAAADLLRRQGYAATRVQEIARAASAPMGSFYFYFPGGKEELTAQAMLHGAEEVRTILIQALNSSDDLAASYARTATLIAERLAARGWEMGCPVATTALETLSSSPVLQAAARSAFTAWRQVLADRAVQAGVAGPAAEMLASNAIALLEGAELLARVERSPVPLTRAAAALRSLVQAATSPEA